VSCSIANRDRHGKARCADFKVQFHSRCCLAQPASAGL